MVSRDGSPRQGVHALTKARYATFTKEDPRLEGPRRTDRRIAFFNKDLGAAPGKSSLIGCTAMPSGTAGSFPEVAARRDPHRVASTRGAISQSLLVADGKTVFALGVATPEATSSSYARTSHRADTR